MQFPISGISAEYIGSTLVRVAGYHVPKTVVVRLNCPDDVIETLKVRRDQLVRYYLTREEPGATHGLNPSTERPEREGRHGT